MLPSRGTRHVTHVNRARLRPASNISLLLTYFLLNLLIQTGFITQCLAEKDLIEKYDNHASSILLRQLIGSVEDHNSVDSTFRVKSNKPIELVEAVPVEPDAPVPFEPVEPVFVDNITSVLHRQKRQEAGPREGLQTGGGTGDRIVCYACMFMHEEGHEQGNKWCDDPFQHYEIPMISCNGPCGKIFRKLDEKGGFILKRDCVHNCKQMEGEKGYTKCCTGLLCNSAPSTTRTFLLDHAHLRGAVNICAFMIYSLVSAYIGCAYTTGAYLSLNVR